MTPLLIRGQTIYQKTAGGVGCKICHGPDGRGGANLSGPDIRGMTADDIEFQFKINPQMEFIVLNSPEMRAIAAYLQYLKTQP